MKMNAFVVLSMGAFLTCAVTLVFSWHLLALEPSLDNYAAVSGYIVSVFGCVGAGLGIVGVLNFRGSLIMINCVISCLFMALVLPTIAAHVVVLAGKSHQGKGLWDEEQLFAASQKPWYYGAQIMLFALLELLFTITTILSYNLLKIVDLHKQLNRKFETIMSQERMRRMLYTRNNYEDLIRKVQV